MSRARGMVVAACMSCALGIAVVAYAREPSDQFGVALQRSAGRTVLIDGTTRFIRVDHQEKLTIRNRTGQTFAWHFDTFYAPTGFPLSAIAPPEFDCGITWVYVRPRAVSPAD